MVSDVADRIQALPYCKHTISIADERISTMFSDEEKDLRVQKPENWIKGRVLRLPHMAAIPNGVVQSVMNSFETIRYLTSTVAD
jgi:hypothetical protein